MTFSNRHGYSGLMFVISLLLVMGDGSHELDIALWRALNVLLGTLAGILVTLLVLPQKATDMMRFMLAENLERMASLFHAHTTASTSMDLDTQALLKATSSAPVKQRGLVDAAKAACGAMNSMTSSPSSAACSPPSSCCWRRAGPPGTATTASRP